MLLILLHHSFMCNIERVMQHAASGIVAEPMCIKTTPWTTTEMTRRRLTGLVPHLGAPENSKGQVAESGGREWALLEAQPCPYIKPSSIC